MWVLAADYSSIFGAGGRLPTPGRGGTLCYIEVDVGA